MTGSTCSPTTGSPGTRWTEWRDSLPGRGSTLTPENLQAGRQRHAQSFRMSVPAACACKCRLSRGDLPPARSPLKNGYPEPADSSCMLPYALACGAWHAHPDAHKPPLKNKIGGGQVRSCVKCAIRRKSNTPRRVAPARASHPPCAIIKQLGDEHVTQRGGRHGVQPLHHPAHDESPGHSCSKRQTQEVAFLEPTGEARNAQRQGVAL